MSDGMKFALYIVFWPLAVFQDYYYVWRSALRGRYENEPAAALAVLCGAVWIMLACLTTIAVFVRGVSAWWFVLPAIAWIVLGIITFIVQLNAIEDYRDAYEE
jgi:hypothetical protein